MSVLGDRLRMEGNLHARWEVATRMLSDGSFTLEKIVQITDLSLEQVQYIAANMSKA